MAHHAKRCQTILQFAGFSCFSLQMLANKAARFELPAHWFVGALNAGTPGFTLGLLPLTFLHGECKAGVLVFCLSAALWAHLDAGAAGILVSKLANCNAPILPFKDAC
jgi:hypothetical protein